MDNPSTLTLTHQTDATKYRFPALFTPSHTHHISNLEDALAIALEERKAYQNALYSHVEYPSVGEAWEQNAKLKAALVMVRSCLINQENRCQACLTEIDNALKPKQ